MWIPVFFLSISITFPKPIVTKITKIIKLINKGKPKSTFHVLNKKSIHTIIEKGRH